MNVFLVIQESNSIRNVESVWKTKKKALERAQALASISLMEPDEDHADAWTDFEGAMVQVQEEPVHE